MAQNANTRKIEESELHDEYVVGGRSVFESRSNSVRDRIERRLDARMLDRIRLDAEVESDVNFLVDAIFSDGIQSLSAVSDNDDPEFAEAAEITEFIQKATAPEITRRPLESILREMFKAAFYAGVKVGEIVLKLQADAQIDGKLVLDRINPKPNSATAFVTDKFYNVIGLVGARREGQTVVSTSAISLSSDEIIPREKFFILAFELEDNDPRGLSQARALIESYCDKQVTREQYKEWRRTSAIPKKVGTTAQNSKDVLLKNADGTQKLKDGVPQTETAQASMMRALEGFANNSSVSIPYSADIKQLEVQGTGVQFTHALKFNNSEIRKVILGDALVTGDADKDARAARESSKDVADTRKQNFRRQVERAVQSNIYRLLTVVNFGEDKAHLTPKCFLGDTEANDWATDIQAASRAGYTFAPEHLPQLDAQFGLEPRSQNAETNREPQDQVSAEDDLTGENE